MSTPPSLSPDQTFELYQILDEENRELVNGLIQLADRFIRDASVISQVERPFNGRPQGLYIHGAPGRGKTHLVNALVNRVLGRAPELRPKIAVISDSEGGNLTAQTRITIYDDLLREISNFSYALASSKVNRIYDNGQYLIVTSNHPLEDVIDHLRQVDPFGRAADRITELFPPQRQYELVGESFRQQLGAEAPAFGW